MNQITFTYNSMRCHAVIAAADEITETDKYIGNMNGYAIYQFDSVVFDQWGFMAIKED